MSNLGWYQVLTSMAKAAGGPKQLLGKTLGLGAILGGGAVFLGSFLKKKITDEIEKKKILEEAAIVYTVNMEGKSNEGLLFEAGDTFKVLEKAGDAGLIEKLGDKNNPYFVSLKFLESISDYKN